MNTPKSLKTAALAVTVLVSGVTAQPILINTVPVGNIGNSADASTYGAVAYAYNIGKFEVTNAQYAAFLNAVAADDAFNLYNTSMGSTVFGGITRTGGSGTYAYAAKAGYENKPVNYVSFWDATRFANWLNNGQGSASTEAGSYTLTGGGIAANSVTRNVGANWVVASENEWYKAAYYDPSKNGGTGGYWLHATQSDTLGENNPFTDANGANYSQSFFDQAVYTGLNDGATPVGTYVNADSFFVTFDQGGNFWEWNETATGLSRRFRGGAWDQFASFLDSSNSNDVLATAELDAVGFRLVSLASVPEPSAYSAVLGGVSVLFALMRRRKARL